MRGYKELRSRNSEIVFEFVGNHLKFVSCSNIAKILS